MKNKKKYNEEIITFAAESYLIKMASTQQKCIAFVPLDKYFYTEKMRMLENELSKGIEKVLIIDMYIEKSHFKADGGDYEKEIYYMGDIDRLDASYFVKHPAEYRKFINTVVQSSFYREYPCIIFQFKENISVTNPDLFFVFKNLFFFCNGKKIYKSQLSLINQQQATYALEWIAFFFIKGWH